jgi:hypothetical protein
LPLLLPQLYHPCCLLCSRHVVLLARRLLLYNLAHELTHTYLAADY